MAQKSDIYRGGPILATCDEEQPVWVGVNGDVDYKWATFQGSE